MVETLIYERLRSPNDQEIDLIVARTIETVLSTVPEFEGSVEKATAMFTNLTPDQMAEMFKSAITKPTYYLLVARDEQNQIIGHSIFSTKKDSEGKQFGSFYTRYVLPEYRRRGIASEMLRIAEEWFSLRGVEYLSAQTHITNLALQAVYRARAFEILGSVKDSKLPMLEIRRLK